MSDSPSLMRYDVVIEAEQSGQEDLPVDDRVYSILAFKEDFRTAWEARRYAEETAQLAAAAIHPRRVKVLIYTLKATTCDCFYAHELVEGTETDG